MIFVAKYNNILEVDNNNAQIQELKVAIKHNRHKNIHVRYMVIYHHFKSEANVDIARIFNLCAHTLETYIKKIQTSELAALLPAPKSSAPKLLTKEQIVRDFEL